MSKKNTITVVAYPDHGAGSDPKVCLFGFFFVCVCVCGGGGGGEVFHHQSSTFLQLAIWE